MVGVFVTIWFVGTGTRTGLLEESSDFSIAEEGGSLFMVAVPCTSFFLTKICSMVGAFATIWLLFVDTGTRTGLLEESSDFSIAEEVGSLFMVVVPCTSFSSTDIFSMVAEFVTTC